MPKIKVENQMISISESRQHLQKMTAGSMSDISSEFMSLFSELKQSEIAADSPKKVDHLFKMWMKTNQQVSA